MCCKYFNQVGYENLIDDCKNSVLSITELDYEFGTSALSASDYIFQEVTQYFKIVAYSKNMQFKTKSIKGYIMEEMNHEEIVRMLAAYAKQGPSKGSKRPHLRESHWRHYTDGRVVHVKGSLVRKDLLIIFILLLFFARARRGVK